MTLDGGWPRDSRLLTWTDHAIAVDTMPVPNRKDGLPARMACFL